MKSIEMRNFWIVLAFTTIVVTGCKSGKETEVKGDSKLDAALQVKVEAALLDGMKDCQADSGQVIVLDIDNDVFVASSGFAMSGDTTDYLKVNLADESAACGLGRLEWYLRMLESGEVKLDDKQETGNGVLVVGNDTIVDDNWRRGGYGKISVKTAIAHNVNTTYFKCLSKVYGEDKAIDLFRREKELSVTEIAKELKDSILIRNDEYADSIKSAMRYFITNGLGKQADCEGVKVAGYSNTTMTGNNNYTLDFYAYFPYDKPAYVVVVRMKKKGLPASAGGMCASVVRRIVPDICKQIH